MLAIRDLFATAVAEQQQQSWHWQSWICCGYVFISHSAKTESRSVVVVVVVLTAAAAVEEALFLQPLHSPLDARQEIHKLAYTRSIVIQAAQQSPPLPVSTLLHVSVSLYHCWQWSLSVPPSLPHNDHRLQSLPPSPCLCLLVIAHLSLCILYCPSVSYQKTAPV